MTRLHYALPFVLCTLPALAQKPVFGNEWINYQQTYYRIPVAQNGLYRLTTSELQRAGLPTATLDPRALQVFHRGVEQAIWVEGEADGKLDAADYLEFLGRANDGVPDSALYRPASAQPHPYYSLYSDTTAFFLTTRTDGQPGKRMARYTDLDAGSGATALTPEPFVWVENRLVISDQWSGGTIYPIGATYDTGALLSSQDEGEGWMGPSVKPLASYTQRVSFAKAVTTSLASPSLDLMLIGRTPVEHSVRVQVGLRTLPPVELTNFTTKTLTIPLSASEATGDMACSISPQNTGDEVSMALLRATYPHLPDMAGYSYREFRTRPEATGRALLRLSNVPATARLYDISTPGQTSVLSGTLVAGTFTSVVRGANTARTLLMVNEIKSVLGIKRVSFRNVNPARINFAIVGHPLLRRPTPNSSDAITSYAAYRASKAGGSYDTLTIDIQDLCNQFNYGERSILAIRHFADYLVRASNNPKFMMLMGRSIDPRQLGLRRGTQVDTLEMIPNGAYPGSDLVMVTGLAGRPPFVPAMAVGRLPVTNPEQVLGYLDKLKEHEAAPSTAIWRKQSLNLSGGKSAYELSLFRAFSEDFARSLSGPNTCANVEIISKKTDNPVEDIPVANQINRGVGIFSFFGHSGLADADANFGYVSDDRLGYRNRGRYPLLLANGCAAGNFYYYIRGFRTFITDWVLTPQRGAVLGLGNAYNGFASPLKNYSDQLYAVMTDSAWVGKTFGEIQVESITRYLAAHPSVFDKANAEQMTLQGDPAIRPYPFSKPDLTFSGEGVGVKTTATTLTLRAVALNAGTCARLRSRWAGTLYNHQTP
jgi:Peptidase family C25